MIERVHSFAAISSNINACEKILKVCASRAGRDTEYEEYRVSACAKYGTEDFNQSVQF